MRRRSSGPYGDTTGDGMVQVSFTLPLPHDKRAEGAALQLADEDGHGPGAGRARQGDGSGLHVLRRLRRGQPPRRPADGRGGRARVPAADRQGGQRARSRRGLRRQLVVVGACIGTDAHTVGIDAILNIKGFAGEKGLEYYREIKVVNLGAQVLVPELVERAPGPRRPTPSWSPRSSPSATRTCTTPARCRRRSARPTRPARRPLLVVGGPRFDETHDRRARRRPDLRPGHDARRGGELPRPRPGRRPDRRQRMTRMSEPPTRASG